MSDVMEYFILVANYFQMFENVLPALRANFGEAKPSPLKQAGAQMMND